MSTFATDSNNDLFLDINGNIAVHHDPKQVIRNLIQNKMQTFLGEVFTDITKGVDYFGTILSNDTTLQQKIAELSKEITSTDGVTAITETRYAQDKQKGTITFSFDIETQYGAISLNDLTLGI